MLRSEFIEAPTEMQFFDVVLSVVYMTAVARSNEDRVVLIAECVRTGCLASLVYALDRPTPRVGVDASADSVGGGNISPESELGGKMARGLLSVDANIINGYLCIVGNTVVEEFTVAVGGVVASNRSGNVGAVPLR